MNHVYLTKRNLLTLLNKLNRTARGDISYCSIIKNDTVHPKFPATTPTIITVVEDEDYYTDRKPGGVIYRDLP